jgi:hypothetical protein
VKVKKYARFSTADNSRFRFRAKPQNEITGRPIEYAVKFFWLGRLSPGFFLRVTHQKSPEIALLFNASC